MAFDLRPAATELGTLIAGLSDDDLKKPTPCPGYALGDLVEHVAGLALGFRFAAAKEVGANTGGAPSGDVSRLPANWRTEIPRRLAVVADAWADPAAWTGMTEVGGVTLPGEVCGLVFADELVVHGWDVARASGQGFTVADEPLAAALRFAESVPDEGRDGELFGPAVPVPAEAPEFHRLLGLTGRDPDWLP